MFCVIYRWRVKPEFEKQFIESWAAITLFYVEKRGAFGSRLHRGEDGIFYAYAQWKSAEARKIAFQNAPNLPESEKMREAIIDTLPEIRLESIADLLEIPAPSDKI